MFGKHLVAAKHLSEEQLLEALERQCGSSVSVGRLAYQQGMLSLDQVVDVLTRQPGRGLLFCELAVDLGYLGEQQRVEILSLQEKSKLPLGQVLLEMGIVSAETLEKELELYLLANPGSAWTPAARD